MGRGTASLAEGAIESMHNLPASLAGSKSKDGITAVKLLPMRCRSTGGVNAEGSSGS